MKNRITFEPDALFQKKYLDHLNALIEMNAQMIAHTNAEDMKGGQNMGERQGIPFVKDGLAIATDYPKFIQDENVTLKDYEIGVARQQFLQVVAEKHAIHSTQLKQATILTGKDLMEKATWILAEVRKRSSMPQFKSLYERLNMLYQQRTERRNATQKLKVTLLKKE
jgi:hypothetical protein